MMLVDGWATYLVSDREIKSGWAVRSLEKTWQLARAEFVWSSVPPSKRRNRRTTTTTTTCSTNQHHDTHDDACKLFEILTTIKTGHAATPEAAFTATGSGEQNGPRPFILPAPDQPRFLSFCDFPFPFPLTCIARGFP